MEKDKDSLEISLPKRDEIVETTSSGEDNQERLMEKGLEETVREEIVEEELSVEELKTRLAEKQEEYDKLYDRFLRVAADFENYKKRSEREKIERIRFANEELVKELLPVLDNLERAVAFSENSKDSEAIRKGVEIILDQFLKTLKKFGLNGYSSIGEKFDPTRHEAVEQVESTEYEANTVIEEYQKGYFFNGRLLRPALVAVTKSPEDFLPSE